MDAAWRFVHLVAAAVWLGGLVTLAVAVFAGVRTLPREDFRRWVIAAARAFAAAAAAAWVLLGVSGVALALPRIGPAGLLGTSWGRTLAAKTAVAAAVLVMTAGHVLLGRSQNRSAVAASRALAGLIFLGTLAIFYLAARLAG